MDTANIVSLSDRLDLHFKLRDGHTLESIKADAQHHVDHGEPFVCRHGWAGGHDWQTVGDVFVPEPENDPAGSVLALLASSDTDSLQRCTRCRRVSIRRWF